jgi:hypothetical protein
MQNTKLIQGLSKLAKEEWARFRQFVASPYFNQREELLILLDFLERYWPDFDSNQLTREVVYEAVFPSQQYEDKKLRYAMSWLYQLLEQFWLVERQSTETYRNQALLMDILSEKGLGKAYRKYNRDMEEQLAQSTKHDAAYFWSAQQWAQTRDMHFQRQRQRRYDPALQDATDYLDQYYFLERLKFACGLLDRQAILKGDYDPKLSEAWLSHLEAYKFFGEPIIELYYFGFLALREEEEEQHFGQLRRKLNEVSGNIGKQALEEMYHMTINYCARKIRQGQSGYVEEALKLYTDGIERGILIKRGELSPWAFTNVVKLALRLKRYAWIEQFIQRYSKKLPEKFRENALHYNLAELYYYTKRLSDAQHHLNLVAYSDLNYYLGARTMLAKIYYEEGEEEPLLSLLAAFTIFLKRNKELSAPIKQTYLHFCELLFQLVRRPKYKLKGLKERIASTSPLTDQGWLLQKLEERL